MCKLWTVIVQQALSRSRSLRGGVSVIEASSLVEKRRKRLTFDVVLHLYSSLYVYIYDRSSIDGKLYGN